MRVYKLLQFVVSTAEKGLWWDHDERVHTPKGFGICLKLFAGPVLRPITKPRFWFVEGVPSKWNEFDSDYHWLIYIPFFIGPFVSIAIGDYGVYFGFKVFDLESEKYRRMTPEKGQALTPSVTTRTTRWK